MIHDAQLLLRRGVAGLGLGQDRGVDLLDVARVLADARERVGKRGRDEHGHLGCWLGSRASEHRSKATRLDRLRLAVALCVTLSGLTRRRSKPARAGATTRVGQVALLASLEGFHPFDRA